jgi:serine/threonine protein kinase
MKSWKFFVLNSWVNLQNEVDLLSKIQHPNVISLLGCSSNEDSRFIVYELMQNGSLETQLHGKNIVSDVLFY